MGHMQTHLDRPVTDKELDGFYGSHPTATEIESTKGRHADAWDALDVVECADSHADEILAALKTGDLMAVGRVFALSKAQTVGQRTDLALYGRKFPETPINCRIDVKTANGTVKHFGKFADTCSAAIAAQTMTWPTPCAINVVAI